MKAIVCGGRNFIPTKQHKDWLVSILQKYKVTHIICGMARGADMFGYNIGEILGLRILKYHAFWNRYGYSAGFIRNIEMSNVADICICFKGGKGTKHMIRISKEKNIPVIQCDF